MNENLRTTLKAWPVIAIATIGLCYLTQGVAKLFGIDLPDQQNVEIVRQLLGNAFKSIQHFSRCAFTLWLVLVILPAIEEVFFRWLLFRLPVRLVNRLLGKGRETGDEGREMGDAGRETRDERRGVAIPILIVSSALFSAAHYFSQPFPDAAFIALFFFGLAQCWLYRKTERLWCPMLNHCLFNLTNVVLIFLVPG